MKVGIQNKEGRLILVWNDGNRRTMAIGLPDVYYSHYHDYVIFLLGVIFYLSMAMGQTMELRHLMPVLEVGLLRRSST